MMANYSASKLFKCCYSNVTKFAFSSPAPGPSHISVRYRKYRKTDRYIVPLVVPAKFRAEPSPHIQEQFEETKKSESSEDQLTWSSGEKNHPLPDSPLQDYPQLLPDGGLQYYGFVYYPRDPNNVEALSPEEVSPLFMVRRTVKFGRLEWWYKDILMDLGLDKYPSSMSDTVIVKNIPEVNEKLFRVKHLVEISPVKLPPNLPLDADPAHCSFSDDAELFYHPDEVIPDDLLQDPDDELRVKFKFRELLDDSRKKWQDAWDLKI